jgi:hypothetical protein
VIAVVAAVLVLTAGVSWGAAGQPLIMGVTTNSAGKSDTALSTASTGVGFLVNQSGGAGPAMQGTDSSKAQSSTGVFGYANAVTSNTNYGVRGRSDSTTGRGVFGNANASSGTTYGVYGTAASPTGYGVYGQNAAATAGTGAGGYFKGGLNDGVVGTAGNAKSGVQGQNTGNGSGVFGTSVGGNGVYGRSSSGIASGVFGEATAGGYGVAGQANGGGPGISGLATGSGNGVVGRSTGTGNGVQGTTSAAGASGVYGENTGLGTGGGYGVAGRSNGTNGVGLYGEATGFNGTALVLHTNGAMPPMSVDSTTQVNNLNADMVDGHHATDFLPAGGKAVDADKLDGKDSTQFLAANPGSNSRLTSNVLVGGTPGQVILPFPDMGGSLRVNACNSGKAQLIFSTPTPGTGQAFNIMDSGSFFNNNNHSPEADTGIDTTNLAIPATGAAQRGTFTVNVQVVNTKLMATIWVSWDASFNVGCVFMAQAIEAIGS